MKLVGVCLVQVNLRLCFLVGLLQVMRIVDLSVLSDHPFASQTRIGRCVCMVGWTEVGPCRLSTVVPVEVHARLVNPGKDTCDLDGGVEFLFGL